MECRIIVSRSFQNFQMTRNYLSIWNLKIYFRLDLPWQLYSYHICGSVENQKSQKRLEERKFVVEISIIWPHF